jgi:hypothetical protein
MFSARECLILVPGVGLEPTRLAPHDFKSCVYTIPPPGHKTTPYLSNFRSFFNELFFLYKYLYSRKYSLIMSMTRSRGEHTAKRYETPGIAILEGINIGNLESIPKGAFPAVGQLFSLAISLQEEGWKSNSVEQVCAMSILEEVYRIKIGRAGRASYNQLYELARKGKAGLDALEAGDFFSLGESEQEEFRQILNCLVRIY